MLGGIKESSHRRGCPGPPTAQSARHVSSAVTSCRHGENTSPNDKGTLGSQGV